MVLHVSGGEGMKKCVFVFFFMLAFTACDKDTKSTLDGCHWHRTKMIIDSRYLVVDESGVVLAQTWRNEADTYTVYIEPSEETSKLFGSTGYKSLGFAVTGDDAVSKIESQFITCSPVTRKPS